jgi:hypothetical protein
MKNFAVPQQQIIGEHKISFLKELRNLYIFLGIGIVFLVAGLVLLFMH